MSVSLPEWKAPAADGQILIWPGAAELVRGTEENFERLAGAEVRVQNIPLSEVRAKQRDLLGVRGPLIASGHQTELYHAGVWAKDVLATRVARRLGGVAYHVAVDTDQPKHILLRWPGGAAPITDDEQGSRVAWSGLLNAPTPVFLNEVATVVEKAERGWGFKSMMGEFFADLGRGGPLLAPALAGAMSQLDKSLEVEHGWVLASSIFESRPYLVFAHHLMASADSLAIKYNAALAEYRKAHRMKSATRPMPDLSIGEECCEVPFWEDDLKGGKRKRGRVKRVGGAGGMWELDGFRFDPAASGWEAAERLGKFLRQRGMRLAPRALTLTMYLRLFLADQFVHGIGGGRYDQVTDELIHRFFGIEPPHFCVTTATMYFPAAVAGGGTRVCLPCLEMEGHRAKHEVLGEEKRGLVAEIARLPRRSSARQMAFSRLHARMAEASVGNVGLKTWRERFAAAVEEHAKEKEWFDRELFYGIQSRERLGELVGRYEEGIQNF